MPSPIPRGVRLNNPGNIVKSGIEWQGKVVGADTTFETFKTPEDGIRALCLLLISYQDKHGLRTLRGIINRYAPPVENDTGAYVNAVASEIGIGADLDIDLHSPSVLVPLATAIIRHENGQQPYDDALIRACAYSALGLPAEAAPVSQQQGNPSMDPLTIISVFGPLIGQLIPQVASFFKQGDRAKQNVDTATKIIDTIVNTTGASNVQSAIETMQSDKDALRRVRDAVVTHPDIQPYLQLIEVGGGVAAAREADSKARPDGPFWKVSAVFWISVLLMPLVTAYTCSSIVGGVEIPAEWPWYAQFLLKLFGPGWSADARAGLANLIVGLVLGGICGVYFGVSVTQQKAAAQPATPSTEGKDG